MMLIPWQKAMILTIHGKADVIEYHDEFIRSAKEEFILPSIIRLHKSVKHDLRTIKFSKKNLYIRDKGRCQYCGKKISFSDVTIDHVHPKSKWDKENSPTHWENVVVACEECNTKKANKDLSTCGMTLQTKPCRPNPSDIRYQAALMNKKELWDGPESWGYYVKGKVVDTNEN